LSAAMLANLQLLRQVQDLAPCTTVADLPACIPTSLLFVTENLLRPSETVPLGLVCFPLPHAGQRSEEALQLTVCGCA
jgi:hypothetical protein